MIKQYLGLLGSDEYEPCTVEQTAKMVWAQIYDGKRYTIGKFKRELMATEGQALDVKFLIEHAGYTSQDALVHAIRNA